MKLRHWGCALVIMLSGCTKLEMPPTGTAMSLCDVVRHPKTYEGKEITLRSLVESDGLHGMLLADSRCKGKFIGFADDDTVDWSAMDRVMSAGSPGTTGKIVEATITGVVRFSSGRVLFSARSVGEIVSRPSRGPRQFGDSP